jgi:ketosteroid isomerase-like protein
MPKSRWFALTGLLALAAILAPPVAAQTEDPVAQEILALAKAEWAALNDGNVKEASKYWADDYTQFNPTFATRIDGKTRLVKLEEANRASGEQGLFSEMGNAKVQVYGDVAILSYNYMGVSKSADGELTNTRAKSTRVYVRTGGKWLLVHANFGADPLGD